MSECVIFDMDGVLADTGPIHFASWKKLAEEIGVKFTKKFFEKTFGQKSIPITRKLVGENTNDSKIKEWADLKETYYREMVKDKIRPLPGVISLIKELKKKDFKLAVGSSGPPENVDLLLKSLKIKKYFDFIITGADVQKGKPDPEGFIKIKKHFQVNAENCVVIEDAPVGIEAAKRAGMKTIALTTTHKKEELKNADLILEDLSKINFKDIKRILKA